MSSVYERLKAMGWNEDDMHIIGHLSDAWHRRVGGTGPLTDETWVLLLPELTSLLNSNRSMHTQEAKRKPLRRRHQHLEDLVTYLRRTTHPFSQILNAVGLDLSHPLETFPESFEGSCALLQNPFPDSDEMLRWDCFEGILTKDVDCKELDQFFTERQVQIEDSLNEWRANLEGQLVEELQTKGEERDAEVVLTVKGSSDLTANLSSNTRVLLRADTIFRHKSLARMDSYLHLYPGFVAFPYYTNGAYLGLHGYRNRNSRGSPIDPHNYGPHIEAQAIAKSILKELHMPNATHFEPLAIGKRFACGRCSHEKEDTWTGI
ncbi:hypothetical protein FS749_006265, partial [Ceratobasidium sp. UAMH 11750]